MKYEQKKIGIWGFGVVGKATLSFMKNKTTSIDIYDSRDISEQERALIKENNAAFISDLDTFLQQNDDIIPSPGIDLGSYHQYQHKFIAELDLFFQYFPKPIIAITGSVGKTTVTHLLSQLLHKQGLRVLTGGNIGTGSLDLIEKAEKADVAVLEVSSFQLELCKEFAPELAIWTNLYPNHLDRHGNFEAYCIAKMNILAHQKKDQKALIPLTLREKISDMLPHPRSITYFSKDTVSQEILATMHSLEEVFYVENSQLIHYKNGTSRICITIPEIAHVSYLDNIVLLVSALSMRAMPLENIFDILAQQEIPEHRLEKVCEINNILFYNDSKATIPASTLAALEKFQGKNIILFVGGVSKGVDREHFIKELQGKVKYVYCFGKEADQLYAFCMAQNIPATSTANLDIAFNQCIQKASPGDHILFSPAGASFDLFTNYQERGNYFKKLVREYQTKN